MRLQLGRSGLSVSPICYGSWQASPQAWGNLPEEDFITAMQRAFEVGINFYDTADSYGDGASELVMGKALKALPRDEVVVATKVYHHFYPDGRRHPDLGYDYIIKACEDSLRRLRIDYIDLYQLHAWDPISCIVESTEALETLKEQGKIRAYGASNFTAEQLRLACKYGDYATLQPQYDLLTTYTEENELPYCNGEDIGVLVWGSLHRGLLSGKYTGTETFDDVRKHYPDFQGERFLDLAERVANLRPLAESYGMSITQLVLTATLMHCAIDVAIVGIKRVQQIEEVAAVMGKTISREDYYQIRRILQGGWLGMGYPQV